MRPLPLVLLALGLTVAGPLAIAEDVVIKPREPLKGSECLDPGQSRSWTQVDDTHILVDGGRHKYRIEFDASCASLRNDNGVSFRGDPMSGKLCGAINDAVIARDYSCRVARIDLLDTEQYKNAMHEHEAALKAERAAKRSSSSP
ncbi:DUF6491 family protein [Arenimonas oryziterrae]|uniref:DUF306 domain-containing protein n=1 Tax=Arenimonas oryziterrae DSM 21050 = YC6267 TaxID=1121015 RepID=A0A091AQC8_9GAMM|nr:DUF6491 family protein [Arenimonas oryziterrae]KFN41219.1 hypothetical protein N789_04850 [Arenimonas oryziterrae DSM 21050 = YC6267]